MQISASIKEQINHLTKAYHINFLSLFLNNLNFTLLSESAQFHFIMNFLGRESDRTKACHPNNKRFGDHFERQLSVSLMARGGLITFLLCFLDDADISSCSVDSVHGSSLYISSELQSPPQPHPIEIQNFPDEEMRSFRSTRFLSPFISQVFKLMHFSTTNRSIKTFDRSIITLLSYSD